MFNARASISLAFVLLSAGFVRADEAQFIDLSLLVAPEYPCTWADGFPRFRIEHVKQIDRDSAYHIDTLMIDGNTGTQMDVPPHSVARPELKLPHSGFLTNVGALPEKAYFLFAPVKIRDCHGGPGRAIALY